MEITREKNNVCIKLDKDMQLIKKIDKDLYIGDDKDVILKHEMMKSLDISLLIPENKLDMLISGLLSIRREMRGTDKLMEQSAEAMYDYYRRLVQLGEI